MIRKVLVLAIVLSFFVLLPSDARALSIFPLRQTVVIDPGQTTVVELLVGNDEDEMIEITPEVDAFTIDGLSGRAVFGVEDPATDWVGYVDELVELVPGSQGAFKFLIEVPADAEPGSHYLGLFAASTPGDGQIGVGGRVGSLLFLHVAGEIREELVRQIFSADKNIYFKPQAKLFLELKNVGTTHVVPEGRIVIKNLFGNVIQEIPVNPGMRKVVPHTGWQGEYAVDSIDWKDAGPVKVQLLLNYGLSNQVMIERISFWFMPPALLLGALLIILLFILAAAVSMKLKK